jgi:ERCC4-related helicase
MNPHQVNAALFALKSPFSKGVLLADEVGLGKTIEAGLVISQKWAEHHRRILLIVPASLRKQWQQELFEKFSIPSTILEAVTYRSFVSGGMSKPFETAEGVVICSYEFAARKSDEIRAAKWHLAVFDEAHRLRNVHKKNGSQRAKDLKNALRDTFKILLTATPLQNSLLELYGIVSVIDEEHFGGQQAFRAQYSGSNATKASLDTLRQRLEPICNRTLRRQVQEAGHINFRRRNARTFTFDPSNREVELYERISAFLQRKDTISYGEKANQLVVLQIRKILGSSTFAIARYLETLIRRLRAKERASIDMIDDIEQMAELEEEFDEEGDAGEAEVIDLEKLAKEIQQLEELLELANSIGSNAKGQMLLSQLPDVLDEIASKGGKRKAVIFTESVRTQRYLSELLEQNGYAGQIVLMNGSNSDPESKRIYEGWRRRHEGTDKISGSKTADMKAAIVEAFKSDDKSILIATESGAEGINLQFCSLLINYDLPWNPQRVEQRIGRCHRYGQAIDVTVVNMLNLKNQTEQRIHELLSQKFHLFDGVFGASDEVLGSLMSGLDFEKEVLRIVQECRTAEEAEREFDALKEKIQDTIDEDMQSARALALDSLDAEVVAKLQDRGRSIADSIPDFKRRLLIVAKAELPGAVFPDPGSQIFDYQDKTYTTEWPVADEKDWQFFRVSDGLGLRTVEAARSRRHTEETLEHVFRPDEYPYPGQLAAVNGLKGQAGWMRVSKAVMPTPEAPREELIIACRRDDGVAVAPEVADKMLLCPVLEKGASTIEAPDALQDLENSEFSEFSDRVKKENYEWLEEEEQRLDRYAKDIEIEVDAHIEILEAELRELQKEKRSPDLSMEEKLSLSRRVKKMENDLDDLKLSKFERRRQVRNEVNDKLDEFADLLNKKPRLEHLFTLRWSVV